MFVWVCLFFGKTLKLKMYFKQQLYYILVLQNII